MQSVTKQKDVKMTAKKTAEPPAPATWQDDYVKIIGMIGDERKQGVVDLEKYIWERTAWGTAPASSMLKFHNAFDGGLIDHSINVTKTLFRLRAVLAPEIPVESCAIVGLYHDLGKTGAPDHPMYIPEVRKWQHETLGQMYKINDDFTFLDVPTRSLLYLLRFVNLTDEEAQAIRYHDGQYCDENKPVRNKECKLTRLLHMADSWSAGVIEKAAGVIEKQAPVPVSGINQ